MNTDQRLNDLLNRMNYDVVCKLPRDNNPLIISAQARNRILIGKSLIKMNVEDEAHRLQVDDRRIINLAVNHVWNFYLTTSQQDQFTTLANKANDINQNMVQANADTLSRISRLNVPQVTNTPFEDNFFNGVDFHEKGFESLILPAGIGSDPFP